MWPLQGFELALDAGAKEVVIVAAASEAFSQWDSNCSIAESLARFEHLVMAARGAGVAVRGHVSCATGCPYQVPGSAGLHIILMHSPEKLEIYESPPGVGGLRRHISTPCAFPLVLLNSANEPESGALCNAFVRHAVYHTVPRICTHTHTLPGKWWHRAMDSQITTVHHYTDP